MSYEPISEWTDNTGAVPDDTNEETIFEIKYRDGKYFVWGPELSGPNNVPDLWGIGDFQYDVVKYRKMKRV